MCVCRHTITRSLSKSVSCGLGPSEVWVRPSETLAASDWVTTRRPTFRCLNSFIEFHYNVNRRSRYWRERACAAQQQQFITCSSNSREWLQLSSTTLDARAERTRPNVSHSSSQPQGGDLWRSTAHFEGTQTGAVHACMWRAFIKKERKKRPHWMDEGKTNQSTLFEIIIYHFWK